MSEFIPLGETCKGISIPKDDILLDDTEERIVWRRGESIFTVLEYPETHHITPADPIGGD